LTVVISCEVMAGVNNADSWEAIASSPTMGLVVFWRGHGWFFDSWPYLLTTQSLNYLSILSFDNIAFIRKMRYDITELNGVKNIEPQNVRQL
jgi:hypothetical protein